MSLSYGIGDIYGWGVPVRDGPFDFYGRVHKTRPEIEAFINSVMSTMIESHIRGEDTSFLRCQLVTLLWCADRQLTHADVYRIVNYWFGLEVDSNEFK